MELVYGAGRLDRRVDDVESLAREWRVRQADWGQLYLEFKPATPPNVLLVEDLAATMLINSRVAGQAAAAVLRNGHSLDLASLPDKALEETTSEDRRRVAGADRNDDELAVGRCFARHEDSAQEAPTPDPSARQPGDLRCVHEPALAGAALADRDDRGDRADSRGARMDHVRPDATREPGDVGGTART